MTVEKIVMAREARFLKAIAQTKFQAVQNGYTLGESQLLALMEVHGRAVMARVIDQLKPVDLGAKLGFATSIFMA